MTMVQRQCLRQAYTSIYRSTSRSTFLPQTSSLRQTRAFILRAPSVRTQRQQPTTALSSSSLRRPFTSSPSQRHGDLTPPRPGEERSITFVDKEGQSHTFEVGDGDNLLEIAQAHDLEMEGACGGSCACSTCHVVVNTPEMYDKMEEPSDDENDMLDLAFGLTETSRLGCQVCMSKDLDGLVVRHGIFCWMDGIPIC